MIRLFILSAAFDASQQQLGGADSREYLAIAKNLVEGKGYKLDLNLYDHGLPYRELKAHSTAWRLPGYPFLIAGILSLDLPIWSVLVLQIAADLGTVLLFFFLPLPHGIRSGAALLYAVCPQNTLFPSLYMTETLLTFFLMAATVTVLRGIKQTGSWWGFKAGALHAAAFFFHPITILLPLIHALVAVVAGRRRAALALGLSFLFLISPWIVRNWIVLQAPIVSTNASMHLAFHRAPAILVPYQSSQHHELSRNFFELYREQLQEAGLVDRPFEQTAPLLNRLGREWFFEGIQRSTFSDLLFAGLVSGVRLFFIAHSDYSRLFGWPGITDAINRQGYRGGLITILTDHLYWLPLLINITVSILVILAAAGFFIMRRRRELRAQAYIFALAIVYVFLITLPMGISRYRTAFMPSIIVLAAFAIASLWRRFVGVFLGFEPKRP